MRNIGIFAHVDAGKTTLTEQLLLKAGAIRSAGSVDSGTAHTDTLPVERRRGISVRAACVRLNWQGEAVNLIDTPGHADFSAEIERSLWALDGAVVVVSGAEGVQPQTELIFEALQAQGIPVFFFINKMDREEADAGRVTAQIRRRLTEKAALLSEPDKLLEIACDADDGLMERYLAEGSIPEGEILSRLPELARKGALFPVLAGSALRGQGIGEVLDGILRYLPPPGDAEHTLCGVAFAAECMDYPTRLAQITGGRGGMRMKLHGYRECPPGLGTTAPRRGVDPLDTSKYILAARSAMEGGIFDL